VPLSWLNVNKLNKQIKNKIKEKDKNIVSIKNNGIITITKYVFKQSIWHT